MLTRKALPDRSKPYENLATEAGLSSVALAKGEASDYFAISSP
jgi:hypothetical protein